MIQEEFSERVKYNYVLFFVIAVLKIGRLVLVCCSVCGYFSQLDRLYRSDLRPSWNLNRLHSANCVSLFQFVLRVVIFRLLKHRIMCVVITIALVDIVGRVNVISVVTGIT